MKKNIGIKQIILGIIDAVIILTVAEILHLSFMEVGTRVDAGFVKELVHLVGSLILIIWVIAYSIFLSFTSPVSWWKKSKNKGVK